MKEYHTLETTISEANQKLLDIVASKGNANNMVVCLDQLNMIPMDHQKHFVLQDSSWSVKTTGQDLATVEKTHCQIAKKVNKVYKQLGV